MCTYVTDVNCRYCRAWFSYATTANQMSYFDTHLGMVV